MIQNLISESCFDLFKSYLTDRKQIVVVDGVKSQEEQVKACISQGSRLGHLLFIMYINNIKEDLESELLIFADDTTLIAAGSDQNVTSAQINRNLLKIEALALKSKEMIFSKKYLGPCPPVIFCNSQKAWKKRLLIGT